MSDNERAGVGGPFKKTRNALRVLVADPDRASRALLEDEITALGLETTSVGDGPATLEALKRSAPDVVLLALVLPGMQGEEILKRMRDDDDLRAVPVIVISSPEDVVTMVRCIEIGACDFIVKPFEAMILRARLLAWLRQKRLHDARHRLHAQMTSALEQLRRAEHNRDLLARMIVHDLQSPLVGIVALATALGDDVRAGGADRTAIATDLERIHRSASKMIVLARGTLDASSSGAVTPDTKVRTVDAVAVARRVCERLDAVAAAGGARIDFRAAAPSASVVADANLLDGVVQSLVANGVRYGGPGGRIEVVVDVPEEAVRISVADDGPAMFPEVVADDEEAYRRSARVERSTVLESPFLGLDFVRKSVESQGWRLHVKAAPGEGTIVQIVLPAAL